MPVCPSLGNAQKPELQKTRASRADRRLRIGWDLEKGTGSPSCFITEFKDFATPTYSISIR